ncbi:MAG: prohibitin family protein [Chitinivibrionales bacterium]|nr:prohibitin family protein [Chitinivibrionales bacterium]
MVFVLAIIAAVVAAVAIAKARNAANRGAASLVLVAALAVAFVQSLTVIPAGHVGVIDFFGKVREETLKSGINMKNPLARVIKLSIKTQEMKESMPVPSKEGLTVLLEVSCLFHLSPDKASSVYRDVGPNYVDVLLVPQFRSVARGVTASYEAKALYTSEREVLSMAIKEALEKQVEPRGLVIETTPLRSVGLPKGLSDAIEEKLKAEQESQRMQFVLKREQQEAERKRIEAQGIADFQRIVTKGISEELLRWKGIEATENLASSSNSKIVIVGGKDGLPLILNAQ